MGGGSNMLALALLVTVTIAGISGQLGFAPPDIGDVIPPRDLTEIDFYILGMDFNTIPGLGDQSSETYKQIRSQIENVFQQLGGKIIGVLFKNGDCCQGSCVMAHIQWEMAEPTKVLGARDAILKASLSWGSQTWRVSFSSRCSGPPPNPLCPETSTTESCSIACSETSPCAEGFICCNQCCVKAPGSEVKIEGVVTVDWTFDQTVWDLGQSLIISGVITEVKELFSSVPNMPQVQVDVLNGGTGENNNLKLTLSITLPEDVPNELIRMAQAAMVGHIMDVMGEKITVLKARLGATNYKTGVECSPNLICGNGICKEYESGNKVCSCNAGFHGTGCSHFDCREDTESRIPLSNEGLCQNKGICRPREDGMAYECMCPSVFYGHTCEISACTYLEGACKNGGKCVGAIQSGRICNCSGTSFTGPFCTSVEPMTDCERQREFAMMVHGQVTRTENQYAEVVNALKMLRQRTFTVPSCWGHTDSHNGEYHSMCDYSLETGKKQECYCTDGRGGKNSWYYFGENDCRVTTVGPRQVNLTFYGPDVTLDQTFKSNIETELKKKLSGMGGYLKNIDFSQNDAKPNCVTIHVQWMAENRLAMSKDMVIKAQSADGTTHSVTPRPCPTQDWRCPNFEGTPVMGICAFMCNNDANCTNGLTCCRTACGGTSCMDVSFREKLRVSLTLGVPYSPDFSKPESAMYIILKDGIVKGTEALSSKHALHGLMRVDVISIREASVRPTANRRRRQTRDTVVEMELVFSQNIPVDAIYKVKDDLETNGIDVDGLNYEVQSMDLHTDQNCPDAPCVAGSLCLTRPGGLMHCQCGADNCTSLPDDFHEFNFYVVDMDWSEAYSNRDSREYQSLQAFIQGMLDRYLGQAKLEGLELRKNNDCVQVFIQWRSSASTDQTFTLSQAVLSQTLDIGGRKYRAQATPCVESKEMEYHEFSFNVVGFPWSERYLNKDSEDYKTLLAVVLDTLEIHLGQTELWGLELMKNYGCVSMMIQWKSSASLAQTMSLAHTILSKPLTLDGVEYNVQDEPCLPGDLNACPTKPQPVPFVADGKNGTELACDVCSEAADCGAHHACCDSCCTRVGYAVEMHVSMLVDVKHHADIRLDAAAESMIKSAFRELKNPVTAYMDHVMHKEYMDKNKSQTYIEGSLFLDADVSVAELRGIEKWIERSPHMVLGMNYTVVKLEFGDMCGRMECEGICKHYLSSPPHCDCDAGYYGPACDAFDCRLDSDMDQTGLLMESDYSGRCLNNGACMLNEDSTHYQCTCSFGFSGDKCEESGKMQYTVSLYVHGLPFSEDMEDKDSQIYKNLYKQFATILKLLATEIEELEFESENGCVRATLEMQIDWANMNLQTMHTPSIMINGKNFTVTDTPCPHKPDINACPRPMPHDTMGIAVACENICNSDESCSGLDEKCCANGCGSKSCVELGYYQSIDIGIALNLTHNPMLDNTIKPLAERGINEEIKKINLPGFKSVTVESIGPWTSDSTAAERRRRQASPEYTYMKLRVKFTGPVPVEGVHALIKNMTDVVFEMSGFKLKVLAIFVEPQDNCPGCAADALCVNQVGGRPVCACPKGKRGLWCSDISCLDDTGNSLCENNGMCDRGRECRCYPGYIGRLCEVRACDHMLSNACANNGVCIGDFYGSWNLCDCSTGFGGLFCQENREDPANMTQCERHARVAKYALSVLRGEEPNDKLAIPMTEFLHYVLNGEVVFDIPKCWHHNATHQGEYHSMCRYSLPKGEEIGCFCTHGDGEVNFLNYVDGICRMDPVPCTQRNPCRNGGTCMKDGMGSYTCVCSANYTGWHCEHRTQGENCPREWGKECKKPEWWCSDKLKCQPGKERCQIILGCQMGENCQDNVEITCVPKKQQLPCDKMPCPHNPYKMCEPCGKHGHCNNRMSRPTHTMGNNPNKGSSNNNNSNNNNSNNNNNNNNNNNPGQGDDDHDHMDNRGNGAGSQGNNGNGMGQNNGIGQSNGNNGNGPNSGKMPNNGNSQGNNDHHSPDDNDHEDDDLADNSDRGVEMGRYPWDSPRQEYFCKCDAGYSGRNCDVNIQVCSTIGDICGDLGCTGNLMGGELCRCEKGYGGVLCDKKANSPCEKRKALSDDALMILKGEYKMPAFTSNQMRDWLLDLLNFEEISTLDEMNCREDGSYGKVQCYVEISDLTNKKCYCVDYDGKPTGKAPNSYPGFDVCTAPSDEGWHDAVCNGDFDYCKNGGTCVYDVLNGKFCDCPSDYHGLFCQKNGPATHAPNGLCEFTESAYDTYRDIYNGEYEATIPKYSEAWYWYTETLKSSLFPDLNRATPADIRNQTLIRPYCADDGSYLAYTCDFYAVNNTRQDCYCNGALGPIVETAAKDPNDLNCDPAALQKRFCHTVPQECPTLKCPYGKHTDVLGCPICECRNPCHSVRCATGHRCVLARGALCHGDMDKDSDKDDFGMDDMDDVEFPEMEEIDMQAYRNMTKFERLMSCMEPVCMPVKKRGHCPHQDRKMLDAAVTQSKNSGNQGKGNVGNQGNSNNNSNQGHSNGNQGNNKDNHGNDNMDSAVIDEDRMTCHRNCSDDADCPGRQKCCGLCGQRCVDPLDEFSYTCEDRLRDFEERLTLIKDSRDALSEASLPGHLVREMEGLAAMENIMRPVCDENGFYAPQQCMYPVADIHNPDVKPSSCMCVDRLGEPIKGAQKTDVKDPSVCITKPNSCPLMDADEVSSRGAVCTDDFDCLGGDKCCPVGDRKICASSVDTNRLLTTADRLMMSLCENDEEKKFCKGGSTCNSDKWETMGQACDCPSGRVGPFCELTNSSLTNPPTTACQHKRLAAQTILHDSSAAHSTLPTIAGFASVVVDKMDVGMDGDLDKKVTMVNYTCTADGDFTPTQHIAELASMESTHCFCVDINGKELPGTRRRLGENRPGCFCGDEFQKCPMGHALHGSDGRYLECGGTGQGGQCGYGYTCKRSTYGNKYCCPHHKEKIDTCKLPMDVGELCGTDPETVIRFYFDHSAQECKSFMFSGCEGNANNFATKGDCNNRCVEKLHQGTCPNPSAKVPARLNCQDQCSSDQDCATETHKCCQTTCGKMCIAAMDGKLASVECPVGKPVATCSSTGDCSEGYTCTQGSCCLDYSVDLCLAVPIIEGESCQKGKPTTKYYYDSLAKRCNSYKDMSCGYSFNSFPTMEACCRTCHPEGRCKEGNCPRVVETLVGGCKNDCLADGDCRGKQVCCNNGCSNTCVLPEVPTQSDCFAKQFEAKKRKTQKNGCDIHYMPRCEKNGLWSAQQCNDKLGLCWCVTPDGNMVPNSRVRGPALCHRLSENDFNAADANPVAPSPDFEVCPSGVKVHCCPEEMCRQRCQAHPNARCRINPCGGCKAEFYNTDGEMLDCKQDLSKCHEELYETTKMLQERQISAAKTGLGERDWDMKNDDADDDEDDEERRVILAGVPLFCQEPADKGPCEGYSPQWYYDAYRGTCDMFAYGLCEGNRNRFPTPERCFAQCDQKKNPCNDGVVCAANEVCTLTFDPNCLQSGNGCPLNTTCAAMKSYNHIKGVFSPHCLVSGDYSYKQCHGQYCWCVDANGDYLNGLTYMNTPALECTKDGKTASSEIKTETCSDGTSPRVKCLKQCKAATCLGNPAATCQVDLCSDDCITKFVDAAGNEVNCQGDVCDAFTFEQIAQCEAPTVCDGKKMMNCNDSCMLATCDWNPCAVCSTDPCTCRPIFTDVFTGEVLSDEFCQTLSLGICEIARCEKQKEILRATAQGSQLTNSEMILPQCDASGRFLPTQEVGDQVFACTTLAGQPVEPNSDGTCPDGDPVTKVDTTLAFNYNFADLKTIQEKENFKEAAINMVVTKTGVDRKAIKKVSDLYPGSVKMNITFEEVANSTTKDLGLVTSVLDKAIQSGNLQLDYNGKKVGVIKEESVVEALTASQVAPPPTTQKPTTTTAKKVDDDDDGLSNTDIIIIACVCGAVGLLLLVVLVYCCCCRRSQKDPTMTGDDTYDHVRTVNKDSSPYDNPPLYNPAYEEDHGYVKVKM